MSSAKKRQFSLGLNVLISDKTTISVKSTGIKPQQCTAKHKQDPADTWRNSNVIIASKRHRDVVLA